MAFLTKLLLMEVWFSFLNFDYYYAISLVLSKNSAFASTHK